VFIQASADWATAGKVHANAALRKIRVGIVVIAGFLASVCCGGLQPSELFSAALQLGTDPTRGVGGARGQR
jgi:hypothetical protein